MRLDDGWNQIQFNLSDFTRRAYGTNYIETLRVQVGRSGRCCLQRLHNVPSVSRPLSFLLFPPQIHANCRIRRVYFSDRLYSEDELPAEFKLYLPVQNQKAKVDASLNSSLWTSFPTCLTLRFLLVSCSSRIFSCSPGGAQCSHQTLWITDINVHMSVQLTLDLDVLYIENRGCEYICLYIDNLRLALFLLCIKAQSYYVEFGIHID